jgi:cell division septum initiation protein DivIVA
VRQQVSRAIERETAILRSELPAVEATVEGMESEIKSGSEATARRAIQAVDELEAKVKAASDSIEGMYDQFETEVRELRQHIEHVEWVLAQAAEASFDLLPTEAPIAAVRATWERGRDDRPQGILFLSDQRLLFEQKQDIATKKILFLTTGKERIQELRLEVALGHIAAVKASRKGLLGHEDHLDIEFQPEAAYSAAHFHIDGQRSAAWQRMVQRAHAGDYDRDRVTEIDDEAVRRVREAPTRCPVCNAPITQRILRGMDRITCEYCGHIVRL